jgi:hypothetical protein
MSEDQVGAAATAPDPRTTYEESDVPLWKLERFREWLRHEDAPGNPNLVAGRAVRAPGA